MNLKSIPAIIEKDLKVFFRSPAAAIVVLLTPLLIILFATTAFNSNSFSGITVSTYSDNYSQISEQIISSLNENNYKIIKENSLEECTKAVKLTNSQICILFSNKPDSEEITFHVDYSRMNLVYTLIHDLEKKIDLESSELEINLVQNILDSLNKIRETLPKEKENIDEAINSIDSTNKNSLNLDLETQEIDETITKLKNALTTVNNTNTESKIKESITVLENIRISTLSNQDEITKIETSTKEIYEDLTKISKNLEEILKELNTQKSIEAKTITSPITISIESVKSDFENKENLIPTLLSIIVLFTGVLISSTFVLKEKKTKAYFRNFMSPTKDFTFIFGTYLSSMIIFLMQFGLVFLGIEFIMGLEYSHLLGEILIVLLIGLTVFIFLGMLIGYMFKSEETTIFGSVFISTILMFFSNIILPIESITQSFKNIVSYNPLILLDTSLKKILLFDISFINLKTEIYSLAIFAIVLILITYFARKITKTKL